MKTLWRFYLRFALALSMAASLHGGSPVDTLHYYSNGNFTNDFHTLKSEFDDYFDDYGTFRFQPFSDPRTFLEYLHSLNEALILVPQSQYEQLYGFMRLEPLLIARKDQHTTTQTVIVTRSSNHDLKGHIIASADTSADAMALAKTHLNPKKPDRLQLLQVPKDLDALMSVGYGMADFALSSREGIEHLSRLNPKLTGDLKIIGYGKPALRLIVASTRSAEADDFVRLLSDMHRHQKGRECLDMLGVDVLAPPSRSDLHLLKGNR